MKRRDFVAAALGAATAACVPFERAGGRSVTAITTSGRDISLTAAEVGEFSASLAGPLLTPGDVGYDEARRAWNGVFDKRPALIARCQGAADVIQAVQFARTHNLLTAVRAGGHSMAGKSVCERGLMIDVSPMRGVRVDPQARTARIDAGVLLGALDHEAQKHGLATTAGVVSHTGAAGLTLGGGLGRLQRKHGLTIDNLRAVDIVTAEGQWLRASQDENADLFWGLRGGGGNFGVVTSFEYRLHRVGPTVLSVAFLYPFEQARAVLEFYIDYMREAPDDLYLGAGMIKRPGAGVATLISGCFFGPTDTAEKLLQPLREFGKPSVERIGPIQYVDLQRRNDDNNPHGRNYYSKSGFFNDIDSRLIDALLENIRFPESRGTNLLISPFGGAVSRVAPDATAFFHRDGQFNIELSLSWSEAEASEKHIAWGREYWRWLAPFASRGFYVNTEMDPGERRLRANYGDNYDRLVALKNRYDPTNLFRLNANIKPTV